MPLTLYLNIRKFHDMTWHYYFFMSYLQNLSMTLASHS